MYRNSHLPALTLCLAIGLIASTAPGQTVFWNAFNDFYVNVPATEGGGDYTQSAWISNAGINPYDTGLTNANSWGYAGGNFNGSGFPSSVGTYTTGIYSLTSGGTYAGPGAGYNLGGGNYWIGYNDNYGSAGLPDALTQIGKYTQEWFGGTPNYANNPGGVNDKFLWLQGTALATNTGGLGAMLTWTAPAAGTYYFSGAYVNGNYSGLSTDFAIVDSTGTALLNKVTLSANSSVSTYGFRRTLSAGDVVQFQVATPAGYGTQASPIGLSANIALNWNAYNDFYLAPTAAGWNGATSPGPMGSAWGYYDANVNGSGYPSQIGSFYTTDGSGTGSQNLYKFSTNSPLGSATLVGASGWADTGGAGFPYYADNQGWGSSLGRYDTPWFSGAPQATNRIWMQAGYLNGPGVEGIAPVLSWTAPASGYYTIDGSWVVANQTGGGASLAIVDNGGLTYDRYAAAMGSTNPFTYTKYYTAGTVIQFQVGSDFKTGAPVGLDADIKTTGSSNSAYFVNTGMSATESSSLSGSGSLTKSGNGTLTLSGANSYSGGTVVSAGLLSGNTTSLQGNIANNGQVQFNQTSNGTYSGAFSGSGSLTKSGNGTLILSGNNTFSGALSVQAGALNLNTTGGSAAGSISSLLVTNGATLLISQSNQVNNTASVTLSGGTIARASGVSETFGALTVSGSSALDFGSGTAGNLTFGSYTPSSLLTVNNFFGGNALMFSSDLTGSIAAGTYDTTSYTSPDGFFTINSISGGFTASYSGSTFTITAIPEPSTIIAAIGLLGLMLWPARRCLWREIENKTAC
jgi:autotransporter-associated beta strand protein